MAQPRDPASGRFVAKESAGHEVEVLREDRAQLLDSYELLVERIAELELALEDEGWVRLGLEGELEFSREGLRKIIKLSRLMAIKNPLIRRGVRVQAFYVFGQGIEIKAADTRVDAVVQGFLDNPKNKKVLTRHRARRDREIDLQVEGQLFFALFVNSSTGEATVRFLPVLQIEDIICNPEDVDEPWWYKRVWTERRFDPTTGTEALSQRTLYYRDWEIPEKEAERGRIGPHEVAQDVWVYHLKVGALSGMRFGVPETYASMDWARAYKDYLSNWASLAKALAKIAYRLTGKTRQLKQAKTKLETTVGTEGDETNPPPVAGSTALVPPGMQLDAMPKTGANVSAEDGLQLRKMVAAGMDVPDPILSNDPQQGTMATSKTLDRPTELGMRDRQMMWADVFRDILGFVVRKAKAPSGRLVEAADEGASLDYTIDVTFPPLLERDVRESVRAIVDASTMGGRPAAGTLPPDLVTRLLLVALAVENIDEVLKGFTPGELPEGSPDSDGNGQVAEALKQLRQTVMEMAQAAE